MVLILLILSFPYKDPTLATTLSLAIPGGGQFYTGYYVKGTLFAGTQLTLGYFILKEHSEAQELPPGEEKNQHITQRNHLMWWYGLVLGLSAIDAYIDSYIYNFNIDMKLESKKARLELQYTLAF